MVMKPRSVSGEETPEVVAQAMKNFDVIICPTSTSITHTNAKINAVKAGARLGSMPGITMEMFEKSAKLIKDGHILEMSLEGRKGVPSTGIYRNPGEAGNLPSGEGYIAPIEDSANGSMIIDGSMVGIGKLKSPLYIEVKDGQLVKLEGEDADKIQILFENRNNATIGELGIGTNPTARLTGVILEDEKIYGTVHIAFSTNTSFGGVNKANCHLDGVIINPTLYLDDQLVLEDGKVLL